MSYQPPTDPQNQPTYQTPQPYTQYPQTPYPPQPPPKKSRTWLWIVLGVLALIVFGCIGFSVIALRGASSAVNSVATSIATFTPAGSTPAPASVVSKVGGTITVNDVAVTLVSVKTIAGDEFTQPKAGNVFIVVHIKIINNSTGEVDYNPFDFHVRSGTGNITDYEGVLPSTYTTNKLLDSGKLSAGGSVEGDIGFQVVKGDHASQLTWQPSFLGNAGDNAWDLGL